jgi:SNF2 family DNA or RNA helicase
LLEQSGFAVFVPPWWKKTNTRIGLKLQMKPKALSNESRGLFGFDSIIEYNWRVALGNEELTAEEFERIASLKVPLVQLKGKWVELRHDDIEEATQLFKAGRNRSEMNLSEALRLGLTGKGTVAGLAVQEVETKGWLARMLKELSAGEKLASLPQPAKFRGELREYQVRGYSWLHFLRRWGIGACLADDMGLGKTIQFIALLLKERDKPVLLICPMSVVGNWEREVTRFGPSISVLVHHGSERLTGKKFVREAKKHHLTITTYSLSARDEKHLAQVNWKGICLDEAQNIKNPSTKQAQAIRRLQSGYRVTLTGTPIENRLSELWSIMQFLNPGFLGSLKDFRTRFIIPIERYQDKEAALRLKKIMQPFMLRRLKSDKSIIRDLPEKIEMKEFCNLTQEQATLYEAVVQEMSDPIEDSEGIERKGLILATLMKLKQVCNHPAHFLGDRSAIRDRSGKVNRLMQLLEVVLAENDKALIFTQFRQMGDLLKEHLQEAFNRETLFLHGGTPKKKRDQMIEQFQESSDGPPLFILSLKAGGLGLNLTQAHHVFHFDRWWNPAVENQATDRVFRIGQKKNVQVHKFVCTGTIEERIDELMTQKQELAETIIGSGEQWLTEMSTDELKKMFALNRDTVI